MNAQEILLKYWGHTKFRPLQEKIINSVLEGKDTLALLPTGGGKSVCFQIPALMKEGICIVVSPLIALMKDQVDNLNQKGIKAISITSAMYKRELDIAFDNCVYGQIKFLYLSPERLMSDLAQARIKKMNVNLIAVDEAHCISQWGYEFRPSYLNIAQLREIKPNVPIIALTATATHEVAEDIQKKLLFKKNNLLQKSFERKNLAYAVLKEEDKYSRLLKILGKVKGTGLVYVRNRKKTKEISDFLNKNNISTEYYHAGLTSVARSKIQSNWINNKTRVIVSTNAFGMGIDKPDVRLVVHWDLPECIEEYFQEAGRAGRDEKKSFAILLFNQSDRLDLEQNILNRFPPIEEVKKTYQALANYYQLAVGSGLGVNFNFDISDFCNTYKLNASNVYNSIKFLEQNEYLSTTEAFYQPSRIIFTVNKESLYTFQIENVKYDSFIKTVLRSYSGIFDDYVKINEYELAKRVNSTKDAVIKTLEYLNKTQILSYIKQTELPQIIYTLPRQDVNHIDISNDNYHLNKKRTFERMEWIIHYVTNNHKCRSEILLSYFGEKETESCGICDVCIGRSKLELSEKDFKNITAQINQLLNIQPLSLLELVNSIVNFKEDQIIKTIQWLIDNLQITLDENQKFHLKH